MEALASLPIQQKYRRSSKCVEHSAQGVLIEGMVGAVPSFFMNGCGPLARVTRHFSEKNTFCIYFCGKS